MTSFSTREAIDNSKLFKSQPFTPDNSVAEASNTPEILNDYRLFRKGLLETFKPNGEPFDLAANPIAELKYSINPFYEINGVGLLYFASDTIVSYKCESDYFNNTKKYGGWESKYFTTDRDIFYFMKLVNTPPAACCWVIHFSNCNIDDSILYRLNSFEFIKNGKVKLFSLLYRVSDMTLMAHIFTIKQTQAE